MTVNEIYKLIAQSIANDLVGKEWVKAVITSEGDSTYVRLGYYYEGADGIRNKENTLKFLESGVGDAFMELNDITTKNNTNLWNRSVFTLEPDGTFNIDFVWDDNFYDSTH